MVVWQRLSSYVASTHSLLVCQKRIWHNTRKWTEPHSENNDCCPHKAFFVKECCSSIQQQYRACSFQSQVPGKKLCLERTSKFQLITNRNVSSFLQFASTHPDSSKIFLMCPFLLLIPPAGRMTDCQYDKLYFVGQAKHSPANSSHHTAKFTLFLDLNRVKWLLLPELLS